MAQHDQPTILSSDVHAWRHAAEVAGVTLVPELASALEQLDALEAELAGLPKRERVPSQPALVANGTPLAKVADEHAKLIAAEERKGETIRTARVAIYLTRKKANIAAATFRAELILALRPVVSSLVDEARPLYDTLKGFAPAYDAVTILRRGTVEQIDAWKRAQELELRFEACRLAWQDAWTCSTGNGGQSSPERVADFDPRWIVDKQIVDEHRRVLYGGKAHLYWERPELVVEPRLNGTYHANPASAATYVTATVMAVAAERPEAGFRLATVQEMAELFYATNAAAAAEKGHRERRFGMRVI